MKKEAAALNKDVRKAGVSREEYLRSLIRKMPLKEKCYDFDGVRTEKTVKFRTYHNYVNPSVIAPTCTQQGYTLHTCSRCGDTYMTDYIPSLGHNYVESYVSPTCTQQGYTLYKCSVCGDELEGDIVPALGHNWVYNSMRHYWRCSRCFAITYGLDDQSIPDDPDLFGWDDEGSVEEPIQNEVNGSTENTNDVGICEDYIESSNGSELQTLDEEVQLRDLTSDVESEVIVSYSYVYSGGKLLQEKVTSGLVTETHNFFYDSNGAPYALYINDKIYYYITNHQGDVVGLIDEDGHIRAEYKYDPYGKLNRFKHLTLRVISYQFSEVLLKRIR